MGRPHVSQEKRAKFGRARQEGSNIKQASDIAGIGYSTGRRLNEELLAQAANSSASGKDRTRLVLPPAPIPTPELTPVARDCMEDFARFRARFFGRISSPWQEQAGQQIIDLLDSPYKEFVVLNCPPGSGKTTLFTHDVTTWMTVRNRALRGLVGAVTQTIAERYNRRMRNTFARTIPMEADDEERQRGLAMDAQSVLGFDYGPFRPDRSEQIPWANDQFTVVQFGETYSGQKEATWTAFGRNTEVISHRVNVMVWDDLTSVDRIRTQDMIEADRHWWHSEAERRLEPYGLLLLQGQRLGSEDIYGHCKSLEVSNFDVDDWDLDEEYHVNVLDDPGDRPATRKKYVHIVYKAHYEEHCHAAENPRMHSMRAPAYDPRRPESSGCLLDPVRLSWRELSAEKERPGSNFEVVYQQEDVDPEEVLVPRIWIDGGQDPHGNDFLGCWDEQRAPGFVPKGLDGIKLSVITVDPAPSNYWSIQWWYYVEPPGCDRLMGQRYLLDMYRGRMDGPDLLDWNVQLREHTGLAAEWVDRAKKLGAPVSHLIVEKNGAQKFLMQYSWFRLWASTNSVMLRPHSTQTNKADENFGVETIKHHYKFGRVRLPGTPAGKFLMRPLVKELTSYPDTPTTDCVMANWFFEYNLQHLIPEVDELPSLYDDIPSWMNQRTALA